MTKGILTVHVGLFVGFEEGTILGAPLGTILGTSLGTILGTSLGTILGTTKVKEPSVNKTNRSLCANQSRAFFN